ncbi:MAG: hypothetical protein B7Y39_01030 [Bdellovibrio sp. 28-41-41]|nr:MAG: hypothetical protein B7Y39_01030 [Bdellovibrio sp. 28-41-41]
MATGLSDLNCLVLGSCLVEKLGPEYFQSWEISKLRQTLFVGGGFDDPIFYLGFSAILGYV